LCQQLRVWFLLRALLLRNSAEALLLCLFLVRVCISPLSVSALGSFIARWLRCTIINQWYSWPQTPPAYRQALVYCQAFGALTASGFQVLNFLVIAEIKLKPLRLHYGIHTFWRLPRLGDSKASENPS
jgi:hypothetical protein